ncbi:MAG: LuxR C-terminal-related transcriptional regulator [Spirochaetes bacterium]|nr:LuxR C-terminal-related transcriptional regulator [Spirochaetota bacterium]
MKATDLRRAVRSLYEKPFCEALLLEVADIVCSAMDANYFSVFITSRDEYDQPVFVSINPDDFIPLYLSVAKEDFLTRAVVHSGRGCVLKRMPDFDCPENHGFISVVQSARPISDVAYLPIKTGRTLRGYCASARAGLGSPIFSDDDLDVFEFIVPFINDAFARSLLPPPSYEDMAYVDCLGDVLCAGPRMGDALNELFGPVSPRLGSEASHRKKCFREALGLFLRGPLRPGVDRAVLSVRSRHYVLGLSTYKPGGFFVAQEGIPCAAVRLIRIVDPSASTRGRDGRAENFAFTPREGEVIRGIFEGKSNKTIAYDLRIDESTVKRYTHNIYEKTGFSSRVELVLGLPPPDSRLQL